MSGFKIEVRIFYEDTDSGGIVYYANYLKYMERARTEYLRSLGFTHTTILLEQRRLFVVRKVEIDYHKPARLDDLLHVSAHVAQLGRASLLFEHHIVSQTNVLLCAAKIKLAFLNADTYRPGPIPAKLAEVIKH